MAQERPIYVVGAGLGGVAAALGLARKGFNVRIVERNAGYAAGIAVALAAGPA